MSRSLCSSIGSSCLQSYEIVHKKKLGDMTVGLTMFFVRFHTTGMSETPLGYWRLGITTFHLPSSSSRYPLLINLISFCSSNFRIHYSFIVGKWNFRHGVGYPKWNSWQPYLASCCQTNGHFQKNIRLPWDQYHHVDTNTISIQSCMALRLASYSSLPYVDNQWPYSRVRYLIHQRKNKFLNNPQLFYMCSPLTPTSHRDTSIFASSYLFATDTPLMDSGSQTHPE